MKEDYAIVLDYLPNGYASAFKKESLAQAIGTQMFTLLELVPKPECKLLPKEKVYIGQDKREKVQYIKGRIEYNKLTATAKNELNIVLEEIIQEQEPHFVEFFNKAGSISVRQHSLELLPGIGKKHMWDILAQREKKPFANFADIAERVKLMPNPKKVVMDRIIDELSSDSKYYLFAKPMPKERGPGGRY